MVLVLFRFFESSSYSAFPKAESISVVIVLRYSKEIKTILQNFRFHFCLGIIACSRGQLRTRMMDSKHKILSATFLSICIFGKCDCSFSHGSLCTIFHISVMKTLWAQVPTALRHFVFFCFFFFRCPKWRAFRMHSLISVRALTLLSSTLSLPLWFNGGFVGD